MGWPRSVEMCLEHPELPVWGGDGPVTLEHPQDMGQWGEEWRCPRTAEQVPAVGLCRSRWAMPPSASWAPVSWSVAGNTFLLPGLNPGPLGNQQGLSVFGKASCVPVFRRINLRMDKPPPLPGHTPGDAETQGGSSLHHHVPAGLRTGSFWHNSARTRPVAHPHPSHHMSHGTASCESLPHDRPLTGLGGTVAPGGCSVQCGLIPRGRWHPWGSAEAKMGEKAEGDRTNREMFYTRNELLGVSGCRLRQTHRMARTPREKRLGMSPASLCWVNCSRVST